MNNKFFPIHIEIYKLSLDTGGAGVYDARMVNQTEQNAHERYLRLVEEEDEAHEAFNAAARALLDAETEREEAYWHWQGLKDR